METFLAISVVMVLVCGLWMLARWFHRQSKEMDRNWRGVEMFSRASQVGPVCFTNQNQGVIGFCMAEHFRECFSQYVEGALAKLGDGRICDIIRPHVIPTYTFWLDKTVQRPIHTGSVNDLDELCVTIVELTTGISKSEVDESSFQEALHVLVIENKQLFVPFSSGNPSSMKEQFQIYGRQTLPMVQNHIKGIITRRLGW